MSRIRAVHLTVLYGLVIIGGIIFADTTKRLGIFGWIYRVRYADKATHILVFGVLSFLVNLSVLEARPDGNAVRQVLRCSLLLTIALSLEELSQLWLPLRQASLTDLASSLVGVTLFAWLALKVWRWRRGPT